MFCFSGLSELKSIDYPAMDLGGGQL